MSAKIAKLVNLMTKKGCSHAKIVQVDSTKLLKEDLVVINVTSEDTVMK